MSSSEILANNNNSNNNNEGSFIVGEEENEVLQDNESNQNPLASSTSSTSSISGGGSSSAPLTKWNILPTSNSPTPRFDSTLVHYEGYLYMFGGNEGNASNESSFSQFQRLDLETNSWHVLSCPLKTRVLHTAVVHNKAMYIYGGGIYKDVRTSYWGGKNKVFTTINEIIKYDFEARDWSVINNNLGTPRDGHCAILIDDEMYIIGGSQSFMNASKSAPSLTSQLFNHVSILNLTTMEWRDISSPTFGRLATAVHYKTPSGDKQYIYVFGGYDTSSKPNNDLWRLDITTGNWSLVAKNEKTPPERYAHSANLYQDKMYIYGGYSKKGFLRDFYSFEFATEQWRLIETKESPPKRRRHQTIVIESNGKSRILLYGGAYLSCLYNDLWEYVFPSQIHIPNDKLQTDFSELFENAQDYFSDICFIVEDKPIYAHRNILAVRSSYFKSLFTNGLKESYEKEIRIKDEKYEYFKTLLQFIYSGDETLVELDNCIGLLHLSDIYMNSRLKTICESKATEGIEFDTVVDIFKQADFYKLTKLRQICIKFIANNHKDVLATGTLNNVDSSFLLEIMYCLDPSLNNSKVK